MSEENENQFPRQRVPGIGELTRDLLTERRELESFDLDGSRVGPPGAGFQNSKVADLQRQTAIIDHTENNYVSPRPPPLLYEVVSTYDARPIQGKDFVSTGCAVIEFNSDGANPLEFDAVKLDYFVPENNIAVLRSFRYFITPGMYQLSDVTDSDNVGCWIQSDLFIDDVPVDQYTEMLLGNTVREPVNAFVIVDELRKLTLRLSQNPSETMVVADSDTPIFTTGAKLFMYGNLLVKTGVPKEFEIANPIGGGKM